MAEIIEWVERVALRFACQWAAEQSLIDLARRGLHQLERTQAIQDLPETLACLCEARGHVALAENDFRQAIESLSEALDRWSAQNRPYDQIRTLNSLGRALIRSGNAAAARAACVQALEISEMLAVQLDDEALKAAFRNSSLIGEIRERQMSV